MACYRDSFTLLPSPDIMEEGGVHFWRTLTKMGKLMGNEKNERSGDGTSQKPKGPSFHITKLVSM
jgi:hypothetical protein